MHEFMMVAGLNVLAFYSVVFWKVRVLPPGVCMTAALSFPFYCVPQF